MTHLPGSIQSQIPVSHLTLPSKEDTPAIVLLITGSFSPPTIAHIRLLCAARDTLKTQKHVSGAYMSPVNDEYGKKDLVSAEHRTAMCDLALADLPWAAVTTWESKQPSYMPTYKVVHQLISTLTDWKPQFTFRVVFVCGSDLRDAMTDTKRWPQFNAQSLERSVTFAVKRRRAEKLGECSAGPDGDEQSKNDNQSGDVLIGPWVGDVSSTEVR